MIFIGIDPGEGSGAVAAVSEKAEVLEFEHFDTWKKSLSFLRRWGLADTLFICHEKLWGMPIRGSQGNWSLGGNYEGWKAIMEVNDYAYIEVAPNTWQPKIIGRFKAGESKEASIAYVSKRFPQLNLPVRRVVDRKRSAGPADAICIALYGRMIHSNVI